MPLASLEVLELRDRWSALGKWDAVTYADGDVGELQTFQDIVEFGPELCKKVITIKKTRSLDLCRVRQHLQKKSQADRQANNFF